MKDMRWRFVGSGGDGRFHNIYDKTSEGDELIHDAPPFTLEIYERGGKKHEIRHGEAEYKRYLTGYNELSLFDSELSKKGPMTFTEHKKEYIKKQKELIDFKWEERKEAA